MSEHGFYHPSRGYWQAVGDVSDEIIASYPPGTISYPLKPGEYYEPDGTGGWTYTPPPVPPVILKPLTRRQLRRGLLGLGIKSVDVEAKIAALPDDQREIALIDWQDASEYERSHWLVAALTSAFNLTDDQVDQAWLTAQEL